MSPYFSSRYKTSISRHIVSSPLFFYLLEFAHLGLIIILMRMKAVSFEVLHHTSLLANGWYESVHFFNLFW